MQRRKCGQEIRQGAGQIPPESDEKNQRSQETSQSLNSQIPLYDRESKASHSSKRKNSNVAFLIGSAAAVLCLVGGGITLGKTFLEKKDSKKTETATEAISKGKKKTTKKRSGTKETAKTAGDKKEANTTENTNQKNTAQKKQDKSGSVYKILVEDCSWTEAFDKCITMGGHLVNLDSEKEFQIVCKQIERQNLNEVHFYVGGAADGNQYYWVDAEEYYIGDSLNPEGNTWLASHWMVNEPSFESDGEKENVMCLLKYNNQWVFNDVPDNIASYYPGKTGYICEIER